LPPAGNDRGCDRASQAYRERFRGGPPLLIHTTAGTLSSAWASETQRVGSCDDLRGAGRRMARTAAGRDRGCVSLRPVIAATAHWLTRAFAAGNPVRAMPAHAQARQAVTVSAWLRYPTALDADLVALVGPGGSRRLDRLLGAPAPGPAEEYAWRVWVDEVLASWAACLLSDRRLATAAVAAVADCAHAAGLHRDFRRLLAPDEADRRAAALLRHPDLVRPVADLHRVELLGRL
jgi:hypothetical protein